LLVGRTLAPLGTMAAMLTRFQQSRVALKALDQLMETPVERPPGKAFLHRPLLGGEIEFRKVGFRYPATTLQSLDGVSFRLKPGERVGVIGRVGSGKSTIARLLLGLYEPTQGAIFLDNVDQRQIDPADLRRNIGYVSQDNYLFFGSVRDNICIGAPGVDDATLMRAAALAGVTDFVATHPQGFDMPVGERGMGLSGGQRQAITIARALLLDPPVVLLDEPTSAMDNASEAAFRGRLERALEGKTMILVTHRSSLLALVQRLIVIDGGRIVADGARDEVLAALRQGQIRAAAAN
jgi:ATP-binding cassette subfamily C protein LapB